MRAWRRKKSRILRCIPRVQSDGSVVEYIFLLNSFSSSIRWWNTDIRMLVHLKISRKDGSYYFLGTTHFTVEFGSRQRWWKWEYVSLISVRLLWIHISNDGNVIFSNGRFWLLFLSFLPKELTNETLFWLTLLRDGVADMRKDIVCAVLGHQNFEKTVKFSGNFRKFWRDWRTFEKILCFYFGKIRNWVLEL